MADNVAIADFSAASQTMATKQVSSVHYPYVTSLGVQVSTSYTRPGDTTAYTAKDAVANSTSAPSALTFSACARANGLTLRLSSATLNSSNAPPATPPNFDLWLFDTSPTATNDNAAFAPSDANTLHCVAVIPFVGAFPFYSDGSNNMQYHWEANGGGKLIKCASADTALYGLLTVRSAYTPANAEVITLTLNLIPE